MNKKLIAQFRKELKLLGYKVIDTIHPVGDTGNLFCYVIHKHGEYCAVTCAPFTGGMLIEVLTSHKVINIQFQK